MLCDRGLTTVDLVLTIFFFGFLYFCLADVSILDEDMVQCF